MRRRLAEHPRRSGLLSTDAGIKASRLSDYAPDEDLMTIVVNPLAIARLTKCQFTTSPLLGNSDLIGLAEFSRSSRDEEIEAVVLQPADIEHGSSFSRRANEAVRMSRKGVWTQTPVPAL